MAAAELDLAVDQYGVFHLDAPFELADGNLVPIDLTGYTANMQIREDYGGTVLLTLDETDGILLAGGVDSNEIDITIPATDTGILTVSVYYDLFLTPPSGAADRYPLLFGKVIVTRAITTAFP